MDDYRQDRRYQKKNLLNTVDEIKTIFKENNEVFENEDIDYVGDIPKQTSFPTFIFTLAIIKDLVDSMDFTGVGVVITTIISLLASIIIFLWILLNGGGWWKRKYISQVWKRYILVVVIEFIPWLKIIPSISILILSIYYKDKKIVRLFNLALDKLKLDGF